MIGVSPRACCNEPIQAPFTRELDDSFAKKHDTKQGPSLADGFDFPSNGSLYHLIVKA